jgi:hypothetical protein
MRYCITVESGFLIDNGCASTWNVFGWRALGNIFPGAAKT